MYLRGVCHGDNRDQQVSGVSHSAIAGQTGLMSTAAETNRYYIDTNWLVPDIHTPPATCLNPLGDMPILLTKGRRLRALKCQSRFERTL